MMMQIETGRYNDLMNGRAELTEEEIASGWHFCSGWDFLLLHPTWPEAVGCTCADPFKITSFGWYRTRAGRSAYVNRDVPGTVYPIRGFGLYGEPKAWTREGLIAVGRETNEDIVAGPFSSKAEAQILVETGICLAQFPEEILIPMEEEE